MNFKNVAIVIAVLVVLPVACTMYNVSTAPSRVVTKTFETDNIINNYEWFRTQYNDILAVDKRIEVVNKQYEQFKLDAGPRSNWTFEDKNEAARLSAILAGLRGNRTEMVSEYNAKSGMANRSIFKSNDLPERVE